MSVLRDAEVPLQIMLVVAKLRRQYGVGEDDVYVVDAEHEGLPEGSYGIGAECLPDEWMDDVRAWAIEGYWFERVNSICLAAHPR